MPRLIPPDPVWLLSIDGDRLCRRLFDRHYSRRRFRDGYSPKQFVGPGEPIVLRTECGSAMWVWRKFIDDAQPPQHGVNCAVFRNETPFLSSELVRQADAIADFCWPGERHYTYVDASAVRSVNPGCCFIRAGWRRCGYTKSGLLILERGGQSVITFLDGPARGVQLSLQRSPIFLRVVTRDRTASGNRPDAKGTRNTRSVWTIPTQPRKEKHFAAFPDELPRRCIVAGCPVGGLVLDPFCGRGTTLDVALRLGRRGIGIDGNAEYLTFAQRALGLWAPDIVKGGAA